MQLDHNGDEISREEYYPFGETSFCSYEKKRYRYCGKERDEESGYYFYGARYYAPWLCRFTSVDPLAGKTPHISPYVYADNNPINRIDPDGRQSQSSAPPPESESNNISFPENPVHGQEFTNANGSVMTYHEGFEQWIMPDVEKTAKSSRIEGPLNMFIHNYSGSQMDQDLRSAYKYLFDHGQGPIDMLLDNYEGSTMQKDLRSFFISTFDNRTGLHQTVRGAKGNPTTEVKGEIQHRDMTSLVEFFGATKHGNTSLPDIKEDPAGFVNALKGIFEAIGFDLAPEPVQTSDSVLYYRRGSPVVGEVRSNGTVSPYDTREINSEADSIKWNLKLK